MGAVLILDDDERTGSDTLDALRRGGWPESELVVADRVMDAVSGLRHHLIARSWDVLVMDIPRTSN